MLKSLRIFSYIMIFSTPFFIFALLLSVHRGEDDIISFLQSAAITNRLRGHIAGSNGIQSQPLVDQAIAYTNRVDPVIIQADISTQRQDPDENETAISIPESTTGPTTEIVGPKNNEEFKFNLLATVKYTSAADKSLALFQSGGRQEWFRKGETVGRFTILEVKNGSVSVIQSGQKQKELYVPPKTNIVSFLKGR